MTNQTPPDSPDPEDLITFTPYVSRKPRHDGWDAELQRYFIVALLLYGCVAQACKAVRKSPASVYALRKRAGAESFAAAWDEALERGRERAFAIAVDRAVNGVTVPRFYQGRFVGTTHRFDHRTIMRVLMPVASPPPPRVGTAGAN